MFQFPRFASPIQVMPCLQHGGLSHSEIPASTAICASTGLIAAYHVLHRLQEPRHPPCALCYFLPTSDAYASPDSLRRIKAKAEGSIYIRLFDFCSTLNFSACINMSMIALLCPPDGEGRAFADAYALVENNGFEPLTPCLQSRCSSQLS